MARKRNISTEISVDPRLDELSDFEALLFTWMIPHAGDDGAISRKSAQFGENRQNGLVSVAKEIKNRVVPGRGTVEMVLAGFLHILELELLIEEEDVFSFAISTFYKYQHYIPANRRKSAQNRASPSPSLTPSHSPTKETTIGIVVKKERSPSARSPTKNRTSFPSDFEPDPKVLLWCMENDISDPEKEVEAFRDYHQSKANRFLDWQAAFRTWLRNSKRFRNNGAVQPNQPARDQIARLLKRGVQR